MRGFSKCFKGAFFNSKYQFNILNSKINQNMTKINFANKSFYTRIINLTNSYTIASILNNYRMMSLAIGTGLEPSETELSQLQSNLNGSLNITGGLILSRDCCKWINSTPLASGQISTINKHDSII